MLPVARSIPPEKSCLRSNAERAFGKGPQRRDLRPLSVAGWLRKTYIPSRKVGLGAENDPTHTNSREPARIKTGYKPKTESNIGELSHHQEGAVL